MENSFRRNKISYDLNYLKAEDLVARPTIEGITTKIPQLGNDQAMLTSLYAIDPEMTPEVADYFLKKAAKMREKENAKYADAFAKMTDASLLVQINTDPSGNTIIQENSI